ncbi:MAG: hypothetical protein HC828_01750 [Blastochloris sp.]|nr:hypothetical protein [Blastochloris sp.]
MGADHDRLLLPTKGYAGKLGNAAGNHVATRVPDWGGVRGDGVEDGYPDNQQGRDEQSGLLEAGA